MLALATFSYFQPQQILALANVSFSGTNLTNAIYQERRVELVGEGHRFFDLVRTGKAKSAFDAFNASKPAEFNTVNYIENKHGIFPIPLVELQLANAVEKWGQNPNY